MTSKIERLRVLILLMAAMCFTLPSWGVLSEYNLDQTLISLSADMEALQQNVRKDIRRFENRQIEFRNEIEHLDEICDETAVMLYSQDERYLYGTLQATQEMKSVIRQIRSQKSRVEQLQSDLSVITNRYAKLSEFLKTLEHKPSTPKSRKALHISVAIADTLRNAIDSCICSVAADKDRYGNLVRKADRLDAYNNDVIKRTQELMFLKRNETLGEIFSNLYTRTVEFRDDLMWRFFTGQSDMDDWNSKEARMYRYIDIKSYISLILAIAFYLITRFTRFSTPWIAKKRIYWTLCLWLASNILGFIVIIMMIGVAPMLQIVLMLQTELYILGLLILVSSTIRLRKKKIWISLFSYLPIYCLADILISYREDLVPLSTVTFTEPFFFIMALIGQIVIMCFYFRRLELTDRRMAWANLVVIGISCLFSCSGYTIPVSILFVLWIGLVIGFLFFTLFRQFIRLDNLNSDSVAGITMRLLIFPLALPVIVIGLILWVTHIFNLTTWFIDLLNDPFVNMPDRIGVLSAAKIINIYSLGVIVNYGLTLAKFIIRRNLEDTRGKVAVWISIGNIIIWLCYAIAVILILDINKAGLIAAVGGASVGIGFALKDTFENFFSGLTLMTGRLRPGDIMEYEGVRGKVLDIGIISTRMETEDGPIMTMPNRQLFEKNFKNMTRNHSVELRHIVFDISENNDPKLVRKIILDSFHGIDGVDESRRHVVIMRNFGSGIMRVELKVWIDSEKYLATEPAVREAIFEAFRQNNIQAATFLQHIDSKGTNSIMSNHITLL